MSTSSEFSAPHTSIPFETPPSYTTIRLVYREKILANFVFLYPNLPLEVCLVKEPGVKSYRILVFNRKGDILLEESGRTDADYKRLFLRSTELVKRKLDRAFGRRDYE